MIKVIKIGGNIIDEPKILDDFLKIYSRIEGNKILVHGGGKKATDLSASLGLTTQMIEGKRVTDAETLQIVTMVYAGLINKTIVAKLQSMNCNALGLSGADANLIKSDKKKDPNIDWGFVGTNVRVDAKKLIFFLENGLSPVFCSITHEGNGQLLNTNADTIASSVAVALSKNDSEVHLVYCFEKKGVLRDVSDENSVIKNIHLENYETLKQNNVVHSGMIPKLENAFASIQAGVKQVKICHALDLSDFENAGTTIQT